VKQRVRQISSNLPSAASADASSSSTLHHLSLLRRRCLESPLPPPQPTSPRLNPPSSYVIPASPPRQQSPSLSPLAIAFLCSAYLGLLKLITSSQLRPSETPPFLRPSPYHDVHRVLLKCLFKMRSF
ncbi:hypothetical protein Droror1_Dr00016499, partial [Drosera rotundifolia]